MPRITAHHRHSSSSMGSRTRSEKTRELLMTTVRPRLLPAMSRSCWA